VAEIRGEFDVIITPGKSRGRKDMRPWQKKRLIYLLVVLK